MDDLKIYQYLARKPDSRAQDIADVLDVELKEASDAMRDLVDCGSVVAYQGVARNGVQCRLYRLSDTFMKSKDGIAALEHAVRFAASAPAPAAAPAPAPAIKIPVLADATELPKQGSKTERAIAFVLKNGKATDEELRIVLDIVKPSAPIAYLKAAVRQGKIHKVGCNWAPGRAVGAATIPFSPPIGSPKNEVKAQFKPTDQPEELTNDDVKDLPQALVEQLSKPAQRNVAVSSEPPPQQSCKHGTPFRYECDGCRAEDEAARPKPGPVDNTPSPFDDQEPARAEPVYRCGLWSDGVLELQRDGRTLFTTTRREHEFMADFLRRSLGAVDKVAA